MLSSIAIFGIRGFQLLFSVVVLGISVNLVKDQKIGDAPTSLKFGTFAGAFGIITGLLGIAAVFIDKLNGLIIMVVDGLASIFFLAGGVVLVTKLKGINCNDTPTKGNAVWQDNEMLNGGFHDNGPDFRRDYGYEVIYDGKDGEPMQSRCKQIQADTAFEFMSFIVLLVAIAVTFLFMKKRN